MNVYEVLLIVNLLILMVLAGVVFSLVRAFVRLFTNVRYAKDIWTGKKQVLTTHVKVDMVVQGPKKDFTIVTKNYRI